MYDVAKTGSTDSLVFPPCIAFTAWIILRRYSWFFFFTHTRTFILDYIHRGISWSSLSLSTSTSTILAITLYFSHRNNLHSHSILYNFRYIENGGFLGIISGVVWLCGQWDWTCCGRIPWKTLDAYRKTRLERCQRKHGG